MPESTDQGEHEGARDDGFGDKGAIAPGNGGAGHG